MKKFGSKLFVFAIFSRVLLGVTESDIPKGSVICTLYESKKSEGTFYYHLKTNLEEVREIQASYGVPNAELVNAAFDSLNREALNLVKAGVCQYVNYAIPIRIGFLKLIVSGNDNVLSWDFFPRNMNPSPKFTIQRQPQFQYRSGGLEMLATNFPGKAFTDKNPPYSMYRYFISVVGGPEESVFAKQPSYQTAVAIRQGKTLYVYSTLPNDRIEIEFLDRFSFRSLYYPPSQEFAPQGDWKTIVSFGGDTFIGATFLGAIKGQKLVFRRLDGEEKISAAFFVDVVDVVDVVDGKE
jgi:hypothetical protein